MSRKKRQTSEDNPAAASIADSPDLPALVNYIRAGRCALFVGAGMSVGAGLPTWNVLLERIITATVPWAVEGEAYVELKRLSRWTGDQADRRRYATWARRWYGRAREKALVDWQEKSSGIITSAWRDELLAVVRSESLTLAEYRSLAEARRFPELASHCRDLLGRERFFEVLREALTSRKPLPATHHDIVRTPWSCIVTTNFDQLLESAYAKWAGRGLPKAPTGAELAQQGTLLLDGAFFILKAHGTLGDPDSMIFTSDDYRRVIHANPAFQAVLNAILLSHAVIFVGYSLNDPNFRLLLDQQLTTFRDNVPPRYAVMMGVEAAEQEILWRTAKLKVFSYPVGQHQEVGRFLKALADRAAPAPVVPAADGRRKKAAPPVAPRQTLGVPEQIRAAHLQITADAERLDLRLQIAGKDDSAELDWTGGGGWPDWPDFMQRLSRAVAQKLGESSLADVNAVGAALTAKLPEELEHHLASLRPGSVIRIACSPESEILPWEWLIVDGSPLCLRHAVIRAPVGVSDRARGQRTVSEPLRALIIGDAGNGSGGAFEYQLPGMKREADTVTMLINKASPRNHVTHLEQSEATYARLIHEVQTGDYDIIHFSGHAWFSRSEALLYLWDGVVSTSELGSLFNRRPPALLVLSTHHTAFVLPGLLESGEFVARNQAHPPGIDRASPLARGFAGMAMRTGVGAFLGCMGSPGDEACAELIICLYRELLNGSSIAFALHEARRRKVEVNNITGMLFVLSGYPETRLTATRTPRMIITSS